jgi:predicted deacetylase
LFVGDRASKTSSVTGVETTSFPTVFAAAAAELEKPPLVVSIHDVAPPTRAASEKILGALRDCGIRVCSLLVVPNYHQTGRAIDDRRFMQWLRDLESEGHEIVVHGYFHQRPRRERETLRQRWITRVYTSDEGEFYDLSYDDAFRRITQGRDEFTLAGLKPRGFIAPAWLLGVEAERAAADAEMEYTTRLTSVRDLRKGDDVSARSLVYSVRNGWRRGVSLAWNGALARVMAGAPLMRLAIHPPDLDHPRVWRQICRLATSLPETRTPTTYRDWLAQRRIASR